MEETEKLRVHAAESPTTLKHVEQSDTECGIGSCKPSALRCCATMCTFVAVYSISGLLTSILSMYIASQITTLEKQFGLSSTQTGFILSCNDIGYLSTTLIASYIAQKVHIPRVLAISTVLYGVSGIICSLAYFISKDLLKLPRTEVSSFVNVSDGDQISSYYTNNPTFEAPMCSFKDFLPENCTTHVSKQTIGLPNQYSIIAVALIGGGMILQGVGKAPRYPMVSTYIDDNVKRTQTPLYVGIVSGVGIFGPAIAFTTGGMISTIYVTLEDVSINPRHPSWIGAWWLGFLVYGIISIISAGPLLLFPRWMKKGAEDRAMRKQKRKQKGNLTWNKRFFEFLHTLRRLLTNPVYMPLIAAVCLTLLGVSSGLAFGPKYLEVEFFVPTWKANILQGVVGILTASIGTILGGIVTTKFKLHPVTCVKIVLLVYLLSTGLGSLSFLFGCSNPDISGYSRSRNDSKSCNACHCDPTSYFPVCGSSKQIYFSPCYAGCSEADEKGFRNCSCIGENGTATAGQCDSNCQMLVPYLVLNAVTNLLGAFNMMPIFFIYLRSVKDEDKAFAIGLSAFMSTLLGWLPGPVIFGKLVDTTCLLWKSSCGNIGSCAMYDTDLFRYLKAGYETILRVFTILVFIVVLLKALEKTDWNLGETTAVPAEENIVFLEEKDLAKTPTDWNPNPIYKLKIQPKQLKSFKY
ncbi:hypothetical protein CHS0354_024870 [Potamilus streckersoni]|uniref:Solute carrier organic anion transporter family member n=1 Tax=Potamilus streckersoni TaxID=2493646 RepID=A0AAE0WBN3_9BIVA|nr:hypothetical protein CHS0354_024870 [Potamilus streckersoni]